MPFQKGHIPWNKNKKLGFIPKFAFKKGCKPTSGSFKKGCIPWNKGKKLPQFSGKNSGKWKDGKRNSKRGYTYILKPDHPFCTSDGYILRSHLVVEKMIGRFLKPEERVHHKGIKYPINSVKNKQDDRPENLMAFSSHSAHCRFERGSKVKSEEIIFDGRQLK